MTPEAVIFRYLEVLRQSEAEPDRLVRLLATDADLLGRFLTVLQCRADPAALRAALRNLPAGAIATLGQAQAWAMLPSLGAARLAMDQWQSVLRGAFLGETLYEAVHDGRSRGELLRVRMLVLLATSGVNLPQDEILGEMLAFRGSAPQTLRDTDTLSRVLAVVESMETDDFVAAAKLAQDLLDINGEVFAQLSQDAADACSAELETLAIEEEANVDWSERLWLQQQASLFAGLFVEPSAAGIDAAHRQASRSFFGHVPYLLLLSADGRTLVPAAEQDLLIQTESDNSNIARVWREGASRAVMDRADVSVADRQVLRRLRAEEGVALPLQSAALDEVLGVLVFPVEEELEPDYAMRVYASGLAEWITQARNASHPEGFSDFRAQEEKRLRELVHEINNPLSVIQNYLHILELRLPDQPQGGDEPTPKQQLALIRTELTRAAGILQEVKTVPQESEEPEVAINVAAVDLNDLTRRLHELHRGLADTQGVNLARMLAEGDVVIETDAEHLMQVLTNLVKNAIEACAHGDTVTLQTHATVMRDGVAGVEVSVRDTGPGLPAAVMKHLFEPKRSTKGGDHAGVGLHVVHRLVTALGGHIDVRSSHDTGTLFSVYLPGTDR